MQVSMQAIAQIINKQLDLPTAPIVAQTKTKEAKTPAYCTLHQLDIRHPKLQTAVDTARKWQARRRWQLETGIPANASLVLVATAVPPEDPSKPELLRTGYGCGKTHIARAILWSEALFVDGNPVAPMGMFFMAQDLIHTLKDATPMENLLGYRVTYNPQTRQMDKAKPHVVVIDDVGTEQHIPYVPAEYQTIERHSRYFRLIDHCYREGIGVILTANQTLQQLSQHIGGRAWSRLMHMAPAGFMVDLTGVPDHRRMASGR